MTATGGRHDLSCAVWRKSTRSNGGADGCVEIARVNAEHAVRDSKDPHGGVLIFSDDVWRGLLDRVKEGSLDL